jgi:gliding motility-associated protein GldL
MENKKDSFQYRFYSSIMPKIYGIGASVVILGAMFKILDWPFASLMIGVGLSTEALVFFLSAFEPKQEELDWSKIYPELDGEGSNQKKSKKEDGVTQKFDEMLSNAKIGPELIDSLGQGIKKLATTAGNMSDISDAASATNEYTDNVKSASKSLVDMNQTYGKTAAALTEFSNASSEAKEYRTQIVSVTNNLSALNSVYELELQDANSHVKALNKFYSNVTSAMEGLSEASKETEAFKNGLARLNENVSSLNKIYGGMLTAMKG